MLKKSLLIIMGILALTIPPIAIFNLVYAERIMPSVIVAGLKLQGKTREEAQIILQNRINYFEDNGLKITYKERTWMIKKDDIGLNFDLDQTVEQAYNIGHERNLGKRLGNQFFLVFQGTSIPMQYSLDEEKFQTHLDQTFSFLKDNPVLAKLILRDDHFYVLPEKEGQEVNFPKLETEIRSNIEDLAERTIIVRLKKSASEVSRVGILSAYQNAQDIISEPLKLIHGDKFWTIDQKMISSWLDFKLSDEVIESSNPPPPYQIKSGITLGDFTKSGEDNAEDTKVLEITFKKEDVETFLKGIAPEIEVEPVNARFKIENEKVSIFAPGVNGEKINYQDTIQRIEQAFQSSAGEAGEKEVEIAVDTIVPDVSNQSIQDLGLEERIGFGISNFAGSPANRRHNIRVGADKLTGVLIPPGEEFSIIQALGEISAATGFKPELVIKPEGTIPEFGGGLCQVSTTLFRAAIYTGLPILERKPHKYVVSYYKPTGMDATIYIPHPDVRFKNDTLGHILIQSRIEGTNLYFDFYGTDDHREITIDGPYYTSNWIAPGPPEYIETNTLAPGQKKQVEIAHSGVSTVFHRTVTRNGEEILKDSFYSKYQPWRAVFLVGVGSPPPEKPPAEPKKEEPKPPPPPPAPKPEPAPVQDGGDEEEEE